MTYIGLQHGIAVKNYHWLYVQSCSSASYWVSLWYALASKIYDLLASAKHLLCQRPQTTAIWSSKVR